MQFCYLRFAFTLLYQVKKERDSLLMLGATISFMRSSNKLCHVLCVMAGHRSVLRKLSQRLIRSKHSREKTLKSLNSRLIQTEKGRFESSLV